MTDHQDDATEKRDPIVQQATGHKEDALAHWTGNLLDRGDTIIYAIVGACFFLGGFFALGYSFWNFGSYLLDNIPLTPAIVAESIVQLISDLLLVVIIMEVLGTVIHYLKSHVTSLRPFLFIGIISATRGILLIGARLTVESGGHTTENFSSDMIELGVNAAVILALGITLRLIGKAAEDYSEE
ncbi:MAG TPA: phosphate-starvation-inducible PsiE family protein [Ktedonobacteraceae bacterium]|nr:phosphate-starvation-inducible PsiE family protein [Ktedonobacteraceae bacterium]